MPCKKLAGLPTSSVKVHVLPGVYHAFDRDTFITVTPDHLGNPMMYNAEATQKAREITEAFLAEHLGK